MSFEEEFKSILGASIGTKYKNIKELAEAADISMPSLYHFFSGTRKGLNIESVGKLVDALGYTLAPKTWNSDREICFVRDNFNSADVNIEPPQADDYLAVPLFSEVGVGLGTIEYGDFQNWFLVSKHQKSLRWRNNLIAIEMSNSSAMKPLLNPSDIVLIDLDDKDTQQPGRIMLIRDPFSHVGMVKRVAVVPKDDDDLVMFYSENGAEYPPIVYSLHDDLDSDLSKFILGHVIWAWTDMSGK